MTSTSKANSLETHGMITDYKGQEKPRQQNVQPPEKKWHLTINLRLILGSAIIVGLVACMSIFSLRATSGLLNANQEVATSLNKSAVFQEKAARFAGWRQEIDRTQAELNLTLRTLIADMVDNRNQLTGFSAGDHDPLGAFLASNAASELQQQLPQTAPAFAKLKAAHSEILRANHELQQVWRPRHAGLSEALNTLKRNINYWNLKVANTIFIRSSMLEIMPEELTDTPIEEFRNSEIYAKYAGEFPVLSEKVASATKTNQALYAASDKLATLALVGSWDKVRLYYRDNFPTTIKSILVDIDQILAIEQQSLHAQEKSMDILNGALNAASTATATELANLQDVLQAIIHSQQKVLQSASDEVLATRSSMEEAISHMRQVNIIAPALIILITLIGGIIITRSVSRPLQTTVNRLNEIARGGGDLTLELPVRSGDEVGQLANGFNKFMGRQREMVGRLSKVSADLASASAQIRGTANSVSEGATEQTVALQASEQKLQAVLKDSQGISENTHNLVDSSRQCTSATLELGATIEEIAEQMENLFSTVDLVSTSTQEMSASSNQIDENVQSLVVMSQQTAQAVSTLDERIAKIEKNAVTAGSLSAQAAEDAGFGMAAVEESLEGINTMSSVINKAGIVIRDLSEQSESIGQILTVIDDVADQTSLLALNATIIAAQAGDRGKAFGVVADEIRDLANRTATSTGEIAKIIRGLQNTAAEAVDVVETGRKRADEEVARAQGASQALLKIRQSTGDARVHVEGIVESAKEQVNDSRQINTSVQEISSMLSQIAVALQQLSTGINQTAQSSEDMREIASRVKSSTDEQAAGSRHIAENMETIREMINRIDEATREQTGRTEETVSTVSNIYRIAEATVDRSEAMEDIVKLLLLQTDTLNREMGSFKV